MPLPVLDGQRFAFVGDSITEADPGYTRLTAALMAARHPEREIEFVYAGVSGDKITDVAARLDRDVLDHKPDWISLSIGINDVWHDALLGLRGVPLPEFMATYRAVLDRIAACCQARVILMTPTVITEDLEDAQNQRLAPYAAFMRKEAADRGHILCDTHAAFHQAIAAAAGRRAFTYDGVHMNADGNALMALTLLEALERGASPDAQVQTNLE